jgi:hypothetical protein
MRAICLAYSYVRVCPVWREKIAILEDPCTCGRTSTELVLAAAAAAKELKAA